MKSLTKLLKIAFLGFALLAIVIVAPFISRSRRPHAITRRLVVMRTSAASVDKTFDLLAMSQKNSATEDGDRRAGILAHLDSTDLKEIWGISVGDTTNKTVVWSYGFRADSISRLNDIFGEDTLKLSGPETKKKEIYFYLIDDELVNSITNLDLY